MTILKLDELMNALLNIEDDLDAHIYGLVAMRNDIQERDDYKYDYRLEDRAGYAARNCELSGQRIRMKLHKVIDSVDQYIIDSTK